MSLIAKNRKPAAKRSPKWPALRQRLLRGAACEACGSKTQLEVHHIVPFHVRPELELVESNLVVLCESRRALNCHLLIGHLGDYHSWNVDAVKDARTWRGKMTTRPKA